MMRRGALFGLFAMVLFLAAPQRASGQVLADLLLEGGKILAKALLTEGAERGAKALFDQALGTKQVEKLVVQERIVEKQIINAAPAQRAALERELRLARSQRQAFEKLMKSVPTREEYQELRRQVAGDLEEIQGILGEHDQRIGKLEEELRDLRGRVEDLESRELGPDPSDEARFDEAAANAQKEITTGLQIRFQIDPGDAFIRTWRRGDPRATLNGRAIEYDARKKGTNTLYLPSDGEYLIYIMHDELPGVRIKVKADSLHDPAMIKLALGQARN